MVLGLNPGRDIYPDWDFSCFSSDTPGKCRDAVAIRSEQVLSKFFPIRDILCTEPRYDTILYSNDNKSIVKQLAVKERILPSTLVRPPDVLQFQLLRASLNKGERELFNFSNK